MGSGRRWGEVFVDERGNNNVTRAKHTESKTLILEKTSQIIYFILSFQMTVNNSNYLEKIVVDILGRTLLRARKTSQAV